ncbi:MAG: LysM domain-containing protein [Planctomycetaceae bacterium]|nr:LysM domain-containing protein [Planctomycetaceae bacterium]
MRPGHRQARLARLWAVVLGGCLAAIGCHAPFFEMGARNAAGLKAGVASETSAAAAIDDSGWPGSGNADRPTLPALYHQVRPGETLAHLSATYGVPVARLLQVNGLDAPDGLKPGQSIYIPPSR